MTIFRKSFRGWRKPILPIRRVVDRDRYDARKSMHVLLWLVFLVNAPVRDVGGGTTENCPFRG